jgi:hypothetical protein
MGRHACALPHRSRCLGLVAAPAGPRPGGACAGAGDYLYGRPSPPGPETIALDRLPSRPIGNGSSAPTVPDRTAGPAAPPLYQLSPDCEPSARISCRSCREWAGRGSLTGPRGRPSQAGAVALLSVLDRGPASPA